MTWHNASSKPTRIRCTSNEPSRSLDHCLANPTLCKTRALPSLMDKALKALYFQENKTWFLFSMVVEYPAWSSIHATRISSSAPAFFPMVISGSIESGHGADASPHSLTAFQTRRVLDWVPVNASLLSFGTRFIPYADNPGAAEKGMLGAGFSPCRAHFYRVPMTGMSR